MFIFRQINFKIFICLFLIANQLLISEVSIAGPGDGIRVATTNSHITARGLARRLITKRMFNAVQDFLTVYSVQVGYLNKLQDPKNPDDDLSKINKDISAFGMDSAQVASDIQLSTQTRINEYLKLYDRSASYLGRKQATMSNASILTQQMRQFALDFTTLCKTGETDDVPGNLLPPLKTPVPAMAINVNTTFSSSGDYQGTIVTPSVSTPGSNLDVAGMASAITAAGLLTSGLIASTLVASGIGAGVGVVVAAVAYTAAMQQAIDDAADISSAEIDHFLHSASGTDVARYYREECSGVTQNFSEFERVSSLIESNRSEGMTEAEHLIEKSKSTFESFNQAFTSMAEIRSQIAKDAEIDLSLPLDIQPANKVEDFQNKLKASADYRNLLAGLNSITSVDLSSIVTATMLQLQLNNDKIISSLRGIGFDTFQSIKTRAFASLVGSVYRSYLKNISIRYGKALVAVKFDLQIAESLENIRSQVDVEIAHAILQVADGKSVSESRDNIVRITAETYRLLETIKSAALPLV
jgi:hypothetical protein